jgi:hypothetical protein
MKNLIALSDNALFIGFASETSLKESKAKVEKFMEEKYPLYTIFAEGKIEDTPNGIIKRVLDIPDNVESKWVDSGKWKNRKTNQIVNIKPNDPFEWITLKKEDFNFAFNTFKGLIGEDYKFGTIYTLWK